MSLIRTTKYFPAKQGSTVQDDDILFMCGFGGAIWQTKRLIGQLNCAGYNVTALDFPRSVLSSGDATLLPELVDEVVAFAEVLAKNSSRKILLVGISLGALMSLNILRRSNTFDRAVGITGGNIATVAKKLYGNKVWPQSHAELLEQWKSVNIYTDPELIRGKRIIFVLPERDKLIDTSEVIGEIGLQNRAGNSMQLVTRGTFSHIGTIIEETILFPSRTITYIETLNKL